MMKREKAKGNLTLSTPNQK